MRTFFVILVILFTLFSCKEKQKSIADYERLLSKYHKKEFTSSNGDFSIDFPKGWFCNQETAKTKNLLYILEAGSNEDNHGNCSINIYKQNVTFGNIKNEFDLMLYSYTKSVSNVELLEKSITKIGVLKAKSAHLIFTKNGEPLGEEIDLFVPINKHQFYHLVLMCDKNKLTESNLGLLLQIAKSFRLLKT